MRAIFTALTCALFLAPPLPALAQARKPAGKQDPRLAEAKRLFDEGLTAYQQGNYEAAISAWERSYEISKKPLIFESIGNAYERLGDAKQARDYLSRWREAAPKEEHELLDARIRNLDARIARDESDAAARKAAEEKAKRDAEAEAKARREAEEARKSRLLVPGIVLTGAGGAAVIAGVVMDAVAAGKRPDVSGSCVPAGGGQVCRDVVRDGINGSNRLAIAGDITWIAGATVAATGAALLVAHTIMNGGKEQPTSATLVAPTVLPGGAGIVIGRRF